MIIVVMGVSGSGKTTIGRALARRLGCPFYDGDDFHPAENVSKMSRGQPLDDRDRLPWLQHLRDLIRSHDSHGQSAVLACSALKRRYRDLLRSGVEQPHFVYLRGDFDQIQQRMQRRSDHYMQPGMLQSQFDALEVPGPEEAVIADIQASVDQIADGILEQLMRQDGARKEEA